MPICQLSNARARRLEESFPVFDADWSLLKRSSKVLTLNRSPKESTRSRVRTDTSFRRETPERTRSRWASSCETSSGTGTPMAWKMASWVARTLEVSTEPRSSATSTASSKSFVVLPMALSTSTGRFGKCWRTMPATRRRCSTPASDDPPNFITSSGVSCAASGPLHGRSLGDTGGTGTGLGKGTMGGECCRAITGSASITSPKPSVDFERSRFTMTDTQLAPKLPYHSRVAIALGMHTA
mmetsp:Transcript_26562/g.61964  ORF Transcript_26562/g.61964 Transcript_26562/m.61964 type:complete len:240 (-) Transcript_26562:2-721(-)